MQSTFISNYMEMEDPSLPSAEKPSWCKRTFGPLKKGGIRMSIISLLAPCFGVGMLGLPCKELPERRQGQGVRHPRRAAHHQLLRPRQLCFHAHSQLGRPGPPVFLLLGTDPDEPRQQGQARRRDPHHSILSDGLHLGLDQLPALRLQPLPVLRRAGKLSHHSAHRPALLHTAQPPNLLAEEPLQAALLYRPRPGLRQLLDACDNY